MSESAGTPSLIFSAGGRACALPLRDIVETMRPLPIIPLPGTAMPVRGAAVVRGAPLPVVDAGRLFDGPPTDPTRFVTVRIGARQAVLCVDQVLGVRTLDAASLDECPPLLRDADRQLVESIATLDADLLLVLDAARVVPGAAWEAIDTWSAQA